MKDSIPTIWLDWLLGLFLSDRWKGRAPTIVAGTVLFELILWGMLSVTYRTAFGVVLYLVPWILAMSIAIHIADRWPVLAGTGTFLGAVTALSMIEEALAYSVGGGLGGHATSLADDWIRSVPSFIGLAAGVVASERWVGLRTGDGFLAGAIGGFLVEIVVARGAQPIAIIAFGGTAMWTYGALAGFPWLPENPKKTTNWHRRLAVVLLLSELGLIGGLLLGYFLGNLLHL